MTGVIVHLLGRPRIMLASGEEIAFRSRKSWALLAYVLLDHAQPTRSHLASLLFADADDPLRALRWSLAEIRRALGDGSVGGNPVLLRLPKGSVVDVQVLSNEAWQDAVHLPGLGGDFLDGVAVQGAPAFESWLLCEQHRLRGATEALLHEAALGSMSHGETDRALDYAVRAASMNPLDENHHALVIRLYRLTGNPTAAEQQRRWCAELLDRELGTSPGPCIEAAIRETPEVAGPWDVDAVAAIIEKGEATVAAGAAETGIQSLRGAVVLADRGGERGLRVRSRLVLAEALIHASGGLDEVGMAMLSEAETIAMQACDTASAAQARAELGYVDFLRARYDRAEYWLTRALQDADEHPWLHAKVCTYLAAAASDRADYPRAIELAHEAVELSRVAQDPRREAYAQSLLGRICLLRGDLEAASAYLGEAMTLAENAHWLAFLPWPQSLQGEVELERGQIDRADSFLRQAFARACQLADPCWEGVAARGLGLVAERCGDTDQAFTTLIGARRRCTRLADPYVWLEGYVLDSLCTLAIHHKHPERDSWINTLQRLAARAGMRELTARSLIHAAAAGSPRGTVAHVAGDIDNPVLQRLVKQARLDTSDDMPTLSSGQNG